MLEFVYLDVVLAWRRIRRQLASSLLGMLMLSAALALSVGVIDAFDRFLVRAPAGIADARTLYQVRAVTPEAQGSSLRQAFSYGEFLQLKQAPTRIGSIAAYSVPDSARIEIRSGAEQNAMARVNVSYVSGDYFETLGVRAVRGQLFGRRDASVPGSAPVAVISEEFLRRFSGDSGASALVVHLNGAPFQVIGVASSRFEGIDMKRTDIWVPLGWLWGGKGLDSGMYFRIILRLGGVPVSAAEQMLARAMEESSAYSPTVGHSAGIALLHVAAARWDDPALQGTVSALLIALAIVVLVVGSGNLSSLLIARAIHSAQEMQIQLALGASRERVARQTLIEGLIMVSLSAALGLVVGIRLVGSQATVLFPGMRGNVSFGARDALLESVAVAFAAIVSLVVPIVQAWRLAYRPVAHASTSTAPRGILRWQSVLLVGQTGLMFALVVTGGLLIRSMHIAMSAEIGVEMNHLAFGMVIPEPGSLERGLPVGASAAVAEQEAAAARLPGVRAAGLGSSLPLASKRMTTLSVSGLDSILERGVGGPYINAVTPHWFTTVGTRILSGRAFAETDRDGDQLVAIINKTMAARLWPGRSPLGECIEIGPPPLRCHRIIGVVDDVPGGHLKGPPEMQYYVSALQRPDLISYPVTAVQYEGPAGPVLVALKQFLIARGADWTQVRVGEFSELMAPELRPWRLASGSVGLVAVLALIVAAGGLYSVTLHNTRRRSREFAIRMAFGASARRIAMLVFGEMSASVIAGAAGGACVLLLGSKYLDQLLYRISVIDPVSLAAGMGVLAVVAIGSAVVPALRASRVTLRTMLGQE